MAADSSSGSEMDYTDSEEERKREEQRAIEEKKRVDKCIRLVNNVEPLITKQALLSFSLANEHILFIRVLLRLL